MSNRSVQITKLDDHLNPKSSDGHDVSPGGSISEADRTVDDDHRSKRFSVKNLIYKIEHGVTDTTEGVVNNRATKYMSARLGAMRQSVVHELHLDDYYEVSKLGTDGDTPLPAGFAHEYRLLFNSYSIRSFIYDFDIHRFWRVLLIATFMGCLMGCIGICFVNIADQVLCFHALSLYYLS